MGPIFTTEPISARRGRFYERIVMAFGKVTRPHENGRSWEYCGSDRRSWGKAVSSFGAFSPRPNLARPRLGSTLVEPDPVAPVVRRGARRANCSMPRGHPRAAILHHRSPPMNLV